MSDTKKTIYTVAPESIVSIEVSGHFYKRVTALYFKLIKSIEPERLEKILKALEKRDLTSLENEQDKQDAYSIDTLFILMSTIETEFKSKDLIKKDEIDISTLS